MKKLWSILICILLLFIFSAGLLLGWALEYGVLLNHYPKEPLASEISSRLWPFRFWEYLY